MSGEGASASATEGRTRPLLGTVVFGVVLTMLVAPWFVPGDHSDNEPGIFVAVALVALIAGYLVAKRPDHPISWLLAAAALAGGIAGMTARALAPGLESLEWWQAVLAVASGPAWYGLLFIMLVMIPLLFPTGTLPTRRWRPVAWVPGLSIAVIGVAWMIQESFCTDWDEDDVCISTVANPLGIGGVQNPEESAIGAAFFLLLLCGALLALASLVVRYRRSGSTERHQIKWVAFSIGLFLIGSVLIDFVWSDLLGNPDMAGSWIIDQVLWLMIPASIAVAILRYRLYDIDVVISKTLVYGALAVLITGLYVGIVVGIGSVLGLHQSGGEPNTVLGLVALVVIPLAFQPARRLLERWANRVVFGRSFTPYEVLSSFSQSVAAVDPTVLTEVARSLAEGTTAQSAGIWAFTEREPTLLAHWGPESTDDRQEIRAPIRHGDEELGWISLTPAPGQAPLPSDERLLHQVSSGLGLALRNQALTSELMETVDQLRESRGRIVAVQDATRRQLERNLHDGAQQRLVALKIKLGMAGSLASKGENEDMAARLAVLRDQADTVIDSVREFARGVYPPLLEAEGLVAALGAHSRSADIPVSLDGNGIGRYARLVETTTYFCVVLAIQGSVSRGATNAEVVLSETPGALRFSVTDDGRPAREQDYIGIQDRVEAAGGHLDVKSGEGTRIEAALLTMAEVGA